MTANRAALAAMLLTLPVLCMGATDDGGEETRDARAHFFTQTFGDLNEELQVARDDGKLGMLLFFEAEACPYCQHMLHKVFNQRNVQDWFNERFVSIAIDIHGDVEVTDLDGIALPSKVFADHRRVFLTPVIMFIDLEGQEIFRHRGMIRTPDEFLLLGEYIAGEHYFDTEYEVFKTARGMPVETNAGMSRAEDTE